MKNPIPSFYDDVLYLLLLLYRFALNIFPSWKTVGRAETFESQLAIGDRGQLEVKDEKGNIPLVDTVAIFVEVYMARFASCT